MRFWVRRKLLNLIDTKALCHPLCQELFWSVFALTQGFGVSLEHRACVNKTGGGISSSVSSHASKQRGSTRMSQKTASDLTDLSKPSSPSPKDVANRMLEMLKKSRSGELEQQDVVRMIRDEFGEKTYRPADTGSEFLYQNVNGGLSMDTKVLKEFRMLTIDTVVWDRAGYWRRRKPADPAGRRQVD